MVTLTSVSYIHEADLICMLLQEAGIEYFIADQNTTSIIPLYSGALGGIRIRIHEDDLELARSVLQLNEPVDKGIFRCPQCGSDAVEYENVSKRSAYLSLFLLNMPFTWFKRRCTCRDCGHAWKDKSPA